MSENNEEKKIPEEKEREPETVKENAPEKETPDVTTVKENLPEAANASEQKEAAGKEEDTVGALLRRTRLARNEDLRDIASYLCIRYQFLSALEEGRYKNLPGEAYVNGFIRTYAGYLGLNPADVLSRYKQEFFSTKNREEGFYVVSSEDAENIVPTPKIVIISVILLLIAFGIWHTSFETAFEMKETPVQAVSEQDDRIAYHSSEKDVSESKAEIFPAEKSPIPVPPVPSVKPEYNEDVENKTSEEPINKADDVNVETEKTEEQINKPEEKKEKTEEKAQEKNTEYAIREPRIYGQKNYNPRLVLMAKEDVWIEITRGNTVVFSRLLSRGDQYMVSSKNPEELFLKTGNAGGLEVYCDGKLTQALGPRGVMRSNVALIPDEFAAKVVEDIE